MATKAKKRKVKPRFPVVSFRYLPEKLKVIEAYAREQDRSVSNIVRRWTDEKVALLEAGEPLPDTPRPTDPRSRPGGSAGAARRLNGGSPKVRAMA